jgi:hypothetical protein
METGKAILCVRPTGCLVAHVALSLFVVRNRRSAALAVTPLQASASSLDPFLIEMAQIQHGEIGQASNDYHQPREISPARRLGFFRQVFI